MVRKSLDYWIELARSPSSFPNEIEANWVKWVTVPVIHFPLAPREARAILEVFGHLAEQGKEVADILTDVLERYDTGGSL